MQITTGVTEGYKLNKLPKLYCHFYKAKSVLHKVPSNYPKQKLV